jgi:hypothetical protein
VGAPVHHDIYVKTAEGWRFKTRTVVMAGSHRTAQGTAAPVDEGGRQLTASRRYFMRVNL